MGANDPSDNLRVVWKLTDTGNGNGIGIETIDSGNSNANNISILSVDDEAVLIDSENNSRILNSYDVDFGQGDNSFVTNYSDNLDESYNEDNAGYDDNGGFYDEDDDMDSASNADPTVSPDVSDEDLV
jgi:hypothetical protein